MDINYELYKVFYYVATTLSFSEASRQLYISQSAVSQSVKVLEKKLGKQLFLRSTKKVQLTPEGEILLRHVEPAMNLIMRGESQLLDANPLSGGQLRIGASDTICRHFLIPYLSRFHREHPNIHIKVTNSTSIGCVDLLENGQVPETWYAQITHYLMVTGAERWYLAAIVFGKGFYHFCIERNEEESKALSTAEIDFWSLVQANVPPDIDGAESATQAISKMFPSSAAEQRVDLMPMVSALYAWQATKEQLEKLKAILQEQQNQICEYMGSAESGASGEFKVSWKTQSRKTFDAKRFAQDHPELDLSAYYKESTSRPFKLTKI